MKRYADEIGVDFHVPEDSLFDSFIEKHIELDWSNPAAPTWLKIPLLSGLLEKYDEVLWLDADVVVAGKDNVFLESQGSSIAMTLLDLDAGRVANTGVILLRKQAKEILDEIEIDPTIAYGSRRWNEVGYNGEMPMILNALGVDVKSREIKPPTSKHFGELQYKFHVNLCDKRGIPKDTVFFHALGMSLRWVFTAMVTYGVWDTQMYHRTIHHRDAPENEAPKSSIPVKTRSCCGK